MVKSKYFDLKSLDAYNMWMSSLVPAFAADSLATVAALRNVRTLGEVYDLPFPLVLPAIPTAELDADLMPDFFKLGHVTETGNETSEIIGLNTLDKRNKPSFEILSQFDRAAGYAAKIWEIEMRGIGYHMLPENREIGGLHFDCDHMDERSYIYSTDEPTHAITHADTRGIFLRGPCPEILDLKIHDPVWKYTLTAAVSANKDAFHEAAFALPAKTMAVLAGPTVHFRPALTGIPRNFLRAIAKTLPQSLIPS